MLFLLKMHVVFLPTEITNPLRTEIPHHIEASQLICNAAKLTSFYMMGNIGRQWI